MQVEQQAAAEAAVLAAQASKDAAGCKSGDADDDLEHHSAPAHRSILALSANGGCVVQPLNASFAPYLFRTRSFLRNSDSSTALHNIWADECLLAWTMLVPS